MDCLSRPQGRLPTHSNLTFPLKVLESSTHISVQSAFRQVAYKMNGLYEAVGPYYTAS